MALAHQDSLGPGHAARVLAELITRLPRREFNAGDLLLRQGDPSDHALYVTEGALRVFADSSYGRVPLADLEAPRLIGEIGVLAAMPRTASIAAATAGTAYELDAEQIAELGRRDPQFLLTIIGQLGRQLDGVNRALGLFGNALAALEEHEFDSRILDELANPSAQLVTFSEAFKRFATQIIDKRRQQEELASAALIQRSFLPRPQVLRSRAPALRVEARMRPARDIGGDFYDFFELDADHVGIAIGDVCGKGVPASLFMAVAITTLRTAAREQDGAARALARTNAVLCRDNEASMFATLFYGVLDLRSGRLDYANCGHNAPLVVSPDGIRELGTTGIPVGLIRGRSPDADEVELGPDDAIVLYTDGVTEAMNPDQQEFGMDRLKDIATGERESDPALIVERIFADVDGFAAGQEQFDDITCLVARVTPER